MLHRVQSSPSRVESKLGWAQVRPRQDWFRLG